MKSMGKKIKMKKSNFFKALVALSVLAAMLVSSILEITEAEYFKTFSKKNRFRD